DKYGRPVVKCYCGNPLTPPVLYTAPVYTGPIWAGFSAPRITIINQSTTVINSFTLYDPLSGAEFTRTPGLRGHDGPYISPATQPQSATSPSGTTQPQRSSTQTSSPAAPAENPTVSLSPDPVAQGQTVSLAASGFAPGASLQITV